MLIPHIGTRWISYGIDNRVFIIEVIKNKNEKLIQTKLIVNLTPQPFKNPGYREGFYPGRFSGEFKHLSFKFLPNQNKNKIK